MHRHFKHIYVFVAVACCIAASSCFKDKGNYNYSELNYVSIDSFGIKTGFYQDSFFLTPGITATLDTTLLNDTLPKKRWKRPMLVILRLRRGCGEVFLISGYFNFPAYPSVGLSSRR